ncbi:retinol dehydrogenase 12-like [Vanessa cardui]|uniref:retinol dehydrogenase 12-like n=1 Tax=Vanessa cardui TaxID=171605 RepID=UPI001F139A27|nr:retinol dehydrogenase 12-like [Vanessa cardui]
MHFKSQRKSYKRRRDKQHRTSEYSQFMNTPKAFASSLSLTNENMMMCFLFVTTLLVSTVLWFRYIHKYFKNKCTCAVSLLGKVVIITGANSGIGYHAALQMAARGGRVILACRNEAKGLAARDRIISTTGNSNVVYKHLDLSSLDSVRRFANDVITTEDRLDVLINNAGMYGSSGKYTEDGILEGFQVNHFGHFLLTLLLLELLMKSRPSRIINVSSILHYYGSIRTDDINKIVRNDLFTYINSKLCNVLFSVEFARRFRGSGVVCNALHPGMIDTEISAQANFFVKWVFKASCWVCYRTLGEGVQTVVHLAVSKECENISGKFYMDCIPRYLLPNARNPLVASSLWDLSEELVGYKTHTKSGFKDY